jgi:putative RecB family exonuclease
MTTYSYSKLETYEKCKLKYKYKYIDKIIPEVPKSIEAHLGTSVHATLEWFYNQVMKNIIPEISQVIEHYTETWMKEYSSDFLIVNANQTAEDYFNKGVEFLLSYYIKNQPFDEQTIATEQKIEFDLDLKGERKIIGFVDRIVNNQEKNEIEIHDYKTANTIPQKSEIEKGKQLGLYTLAIKEIFGKDKNVCMVWHYLAHNTKICLRKNNEELEKLKQDTIHLIDEIEKTKYFPANKSRLCDWCEYRTTCSAWNPNVGFNQRVLG